MVDLDDTQDFVLNKIPGVEEDDGLNSLIIVNWNIERGLVLEEIIKELEELHPTVLLLQEVDWGRRKTNNRNISHEIAVRLNLPYYAFGIEYRFKQGYHGNSILSKFPIKNVNLIKLPNFYNWKGRKGGRIALVATIEADKTLLFGDIVCVSAHLENKCTPEQRREQFAFLSEKLFESTNYDSKIIIGGDMNTFATGFAKFYDSNSSISIFSFVSKRFLTIFVRLGCLG